MLQQNLQKLLDKDLTRKEFLGLMGLTVASLTGITGLIRELESHASTPTASTEPENGSLSGNVSAVNDTTASGGKAVKFGAASGGVSDATLNTLITSTPPTGLSPAPSGPQAGTPGEFDASVLATNEIWDNFDGTTLDSRLWLKDTINQGGTQVYQTDHMYLDGNSHAVMHCTQTGSTINSGRFTSRTKFAMMNGWFAASIKMPLAKNGVGGAWFPAFWLLHVDYNINPYYAEFDLMEEFGDSTTYSTHLYLDSGTSSDDKEVYKDVPASQGSDSSLAYHTYWCLREPTHIRIGVDSLVMGDWHSTDFSANQWNRHMQQAMYFIFNFAAAPSWLPAPKPSDFPADMLVDWAWYKPLSAL